MYRKNMSKMLAVMAIAVMAVSVFGGCIGGEEETPAPTTTTAAPGTTTPAQTQKPFWEREPVKIGFVHPFTGPASELGATVKRGIDLAVDELNESGGILGRPVKLYLADGKCDPTEAPKAIRKVITVDNVDAILGPQCSSAVLSVLPIVNQEKVPMVVYAATSPEITKQIGEGGYEWIYRINPMDFTMGPPLAEYAMEELDVESISLLALNNDWGRGNVEVWKTLSEEMGFEIKSTDYFQYGDTEFTPILTKIKNEDPDALYVVADYQEAYNVLKQFHELELDEAGIQIIGRGAIAMKHMYEVVGEENEELVNGIYGINFYSFKIDTPEHNEFKEKFREHSGYYPEIGGAWGYNAMNFLAKAMEKAGTTDKEAVRKALGEIEMDTFLGHIECDHYHQSWSPVWITRLIDGDEILIKKIPTEQYQEIFYESLEE